MPVIKVTKFNDEEVIINAELIEMIEARPDTIITFTTGKKIVVSESIAEVIRRIIEYRQVIRPIIRTNVPVDKTIDYMDVDRAVDVLDNQGG
jgi:flagellar protein FlbD